MTSPSVKATEELEKPATAKPLSSQWIPDDDTKPIENTSYKKVPQQYIIKKMNLNDTTSR